MNADDTKARFIAASKLLSGETTTVDGEDVFDPGGCGFGKVEEVKVEEVDAI